MKAKVLYNGIINKENQCQHNYCIINQRNIKYKQRNSTNGRKNDH